MRFALGTLLCAVAFCVLFHLPVGAQERPAPPNMFPKRLGLPFSAPQSRSESIPRFRIPGKKVSQYSVDDWGAWIDSTWGPGQTAAQQLHVFDTFWDRVNTGWGGFPNIVLNWDSIRALYRPQIGSGLSRGRFAALMSRVWMSLMEHHTYIYDYAVDRTFGNDNIGLWSYKAGVPLLVIGTLYWDLLGAPVTALDDSTGLVYRAAVGNPLGLQPGDIILGYEGVPWKKLYPRLLEVGVPINRYWTSSPGSTPESRIQLAMSAVGWNWGMFDTIDVVKSATGDTVHLPTAPLATLTQTIWATDQVPVPGVPMPEGGANNTNAVSWGVVQGTNIDYIYVWDWSTSSTPQRFAEAVADLRYTRKIAGLIIDFRMNWGGDVRFANGGFARLFGFDPTVNWAFAARANASDHMSFTPIQYDFGFTPLGTSFDRPIAMLIGPGCLSAGDYNAFRLRFHPMARSFGKPTNGAFVAGSQQTGTLEQDWNYEYWTGLMVSSVPGGGYMIHKGVQPDESVWLTRDGVAKGEDDVVKRALEWINTLSYAHDVHFGHTASDTVRITARVENPLAHTLKIVLTIDGASGTSFDSTLMHNDGLHGDGAPGDTVWGSLYVPMSEGLYRVGIRTDDITVGSSRILPNVGEFIFTHKPVISVDTRTLYFGSIDVNTARRDTSFLVENLGFQEDSISISLDYVNVAPELAVAVSPSVFKLTPGASQKVKFSITPRLLAPGRNYNSVVMIDSRFGFGTTHFEKTMAFQIEGTLFAQDGSPQLPAEFALHQNYPNPFNPSTEIRYQLPEVSNVKLVVYDLLGREVCVLVDERENARSYEVKFDAAGLSSGVYIYRLRAGDFVATKKMVVLK